MTQMNCEYCGKDVVHKCCVCGKLVCAEHARLGTICHPCKREAIVKYAIERVTSNEEKKEIQEFVQRFWGEQEQLAFDKRFMVAELPAFMAQVENNEVGFVSFAEVGDAMLIVALGILPKYQNSGIGSGLVASIETEAKKLQKKILLVSTSNDDLPALAFYQKLGFQIFEVRPNVIAEKHGKILEGIGGLPVRDELRLRKIL